MPCREDRCESSVPAGRPGARPAGPPPQPPRGRPPRPGDAWGGRRGRSSGARRPCPTAPSCAGWRATSSKGRSCKRSWFFGSLGVFLDAPAELVCGRDPLAFQLRRADDGAAYAADEVALRMVGRGDCDTFPRSGGCIRDALDRMVRRMSFARENHTHALHHRLRARGRRRVVCVEDYGYLVARDQPVHAEAFDQLVARRLERHSEQSLERRPRMDDVVAIDDELQGRMLSWPATMSM